MQSIDIQKSRVVIELTTILNLLSQNIEFEIDIFGNISNEKNLKHPIVFASDKSYRFNKLLDIKTISSDIFNKYKPKIDGTKCELNLLFAWQNIIDLNKTRMLYFDHQSDGIEIFEDKEMEEIGWQATTFDITYREISEFIEKSSEGFLVFYDNGVQFNGFAIVDNIEKTKQNVKSFISKKINNLLENEFIKDELDDDQLEALEFFEIKV